MKMICDVPDEVIKSIKDGTYCGSWMVEKMIAKGIPLKQEPCTDAISRENKQGTTDGNIYKCPCGLSWDIDKAIRYHYCPNCGRKSGR